ncbi:MAG: hypothetical protein R3F65_09670 [bacterium]
MAGLEVDGALKWRRGSGQLAEGTQEQGETSVARGEVGAEVACLEVDGGLEVVSGSGKLAEALQEQRGCDGCGEDSVVGAEVACVEVDGGPRGGGGRRAAFEVVEDGCQAAGVAGELGVVGAEVAGLEVDSDLEVAAGR